MFEVIEVYRYGEGSCKWGKKFNYELQAEKAIMEDYNMNFDNASDMIEKYQIINKNGKVIKTIHCD